MVAEALTQDEIDALLKGTPLPETSGGGGGETSMISAEEKDTVKSYAQMIANSGQNVLGTLMGDAVTIQIGDIQEVDADSIGGVVDGPVVASGFGYKGLLSGDTVLNFKTDDALRLANQMTGGGSEGEFGDLEESALSETLSQILNGANTELAGQLGGEVQIDMPNVTVNPGNLGSILPPSDQKQILVNYTINSPNLTGTFTQVLPRSLVNSLAMAASSPGGPVMEGPRAYGGATGAAPILAQPAAFEPLIGGMGTSADTTNLELILDISLDIKVELGRSYKKVREVLELGPGSVVELNKLAGEPVDILVNDKLFAKGEVVVIDENFGVRITDILSIAERIEALK